LLVGGRRRFGREVLIAARWRGLAGSLSAGSECVTIEAAKAFAWNPAIEPLRAVVLGHIEALRIPIAPPVFVPC
jgi:hypothetical protein